MRETSIGLHAFALNVNVTPLAGVANCFKMAAHGAEAVRMAAEDIVEAFMSNRKNSNQLLDLECLLLSENAREVNDAIKAIEKLFIYLFQNGHLKFNADSADPGNAEEKYHSWLSERCHEIKCQLLEYFQHEDKEIQKASFLALMNILKVEGKYPLKDIPDSTWYFPKDSFQNIIVSLLSDKKDMQAVIFFLKEFASYRDIMFYILKSVLDVLNRIETVPSDYLLQNIFAVLSQIHFVKTKSFSESGNSYICRTDEGPNFVLKQKVFGGAFSAVWLKFLRFKMPSTLYKKILLIMHKEILPNLRDPLLLTDFLTNSYNCGGAVSLLALDGLFFLIQNCNLEYPNFYKKLYALFDPNVLFSKYRARFFHQADFFLSSTHLPAYLVASFIKRFSRLTLSATSDILLVLLPFIGNLLIRHPNLKIMIHRSDIDDISNDPFNSEETDPAKSNAIESSLWEIKTLQDYWHADVRKKAKFINNDLPPNEWDIADKLETTGDDMIERDDILNSREIGFSVDKPVEWELYTPPKKKMKCI